MAAQKVFSRLRPNDPLVEELASGKHEWWNSLVSRLFEYPELSIQVRGDYLSVYYRMGSLLTIRLRNKKIVCSIHYKYLIDSHSPEYVDVTPSGSDIDVTLPTCKLVTSILEEENFKRIRSNIAALAGEEKRIQSNLVELNRRTLLDAEIAFTDSGATADPEEADDPSSGSTRIDLVNYDKNRNMLVFVELKQIFDKRLYSDSKGFKEVNAQIAKYTVFAQKHEPKIIEAYNNVIAVKKKLGLLPDSWTLASAKIERVEPKPILAIAAYRQDIIDALKDKVRKDLNIEGLAALYFFGSGVDLNLAQDKNKELNIKN